jgi:hypothetical protein
MGKIHMRQPRYWYGKTPIRDRLYNATIVAFFVTGRFREDGYSVPRRFRKAYRRWDIDVDVYALAGIHLIYRLANWWMGTRWCLERLLFRYGGLVGPEGSYWSEYRIADVPASPWSRVPRGTVSIF